MHKIYLIIKLNKRENCLYYRSWRNTYKSIWFGYIRLVKKDTQESDRNDCLKGRKMEIRGWEENIFSTYLILPIEFVPCICEV